MRLVRTTFKRQANAECRSNPSHFGKTSVKTHILALFQKLGAANRTEAVALAFSKHLLKI